MIDMLFVFDALIRLTHFFASSSLVFSVGWRKVGEIRSEMMFFGLKLREKTWVANGFFKYKRSKTGFFRIKIFYQKGAKCKKF